MTSAKMKEACVRDGKAKNNEYITQSKLVERGWTQALIKKFLPEPILKSNPCYACAAPMKLWDIADIEAVEKTPEFCLAQEKANCRKKAAKKATETKVNRLMEEINNLISHLQIEKIDDKAVVDRALESKQEWYRWQADIRDDFYKNDVCGADQETIDRWTVNYISIN